MSDLGSVGGIDELGDGIVDGLGSRVAQVDGDQVGGFTDFQGPGLLLQAKGAGAVEGGHA